MILSVVQINSWTTHNILIIQSGKNSKGTDKLCCINISEIINEAFLRR